MAMDTGDAILELQAAADVCGHIVVELRDEAKLTTDPHRWTRLRDGVVAMNELELRLRNLAAVVELKAGKSWAESL